MTKPNPSRREFIALSGTAAMAWLGSDPVAFRRALAAARAAAAGEPVPFENLTPEQAADVDAIASRLIPSDDALPGAHEAQAVVFIDRSLGSFAKDQKALVVEGLDDLRRRAAEKWPGAGRFATLPAERQIELLHDIEDTPFFGQIRFGVVAGTFANPNWGGNRDGAGYRILDFEPRYAWTPPFGYYDAEANR